MPDLPVRSRVQADPVHSASPAHVMAGSTLTVAAQTEFGAGRETAGSAVKLLRLTLERDGTVVLDLPFTEVGQSLTTALATVIAHTLATPVRSVRVRSPHARPEPRGALPAEGSSVIQELVRAMATLARQRLAAAASREWGVSALDLRLSEGVVYGSDRRLSTYGTLTEAAASSMTCEVITPIPALVPPGAADHCLRDEMGPRIAGLVLGAVIQGGPRRRANGRIPPPRKANAGRRPVTPISFVALGLPASLRRDRVVVIHVASHDGAVRPNSDTRERGTR